MTALGPFILDCNLRWKYEDTLKLTDSNQPLWRLKDSVTVIYSQQLPGRLFNGHTNRLAREQNCVTITIICIDPLTGLSMSLPCYSFTLSLLY